MKTRDVQTRLVDSTRWDHLKLRDDDIVIASWGKTGTTLTQQVVSQLILGGDGVAAMDTSPWVDARFMAPLGEMLAGLEAQTHRRFLKTHLSFDALVFDPYVKYLYVARDARDVLWSAYNHHLSFTPLAFAHINNAELDDCPDFGPPSVDVREYYMRWLNNEPCGGFTDEPFWAHVQGWWDQRHLPNVLLLHYARLTSDLAGEMRRIAAFLGVDLDEAKLPQMVARCGIDYMREHTAALPFMGLMFENGAASFFNKGTNGRWRDVLSAEEIARCDDVAAANLTPDCAHWLKPGERPDWPTAADAVDGRSEDD